MAKAKKKVIPKKGLPSANVLFRELSVTGVQIYKVPGVIDYNPDELVGTKGLEIYKKMMLDDQIKAVVTMKKFARLMTNWELIPASESSKDKEVAEFVKDNLEQMHGTFEDNLLNILTALEYGYSVTEELWERIERGKWAGKIGLKGLKTREPFFYGFESDEHGNLLTKGLIYTGPVIFNPGQKAQQDAEKLPINKFIIYSYSKEFSNWYGKSDLRAAYRSWWSKEILIRFMNIYMERFGMPTHVGKYPKGMKKVDRDKLKDVLDRVQSKYSIVIPDDISIELLEAAQQGDVGFKSAIEMHNRFIARSVLIPDLMGYTEASGGGSYALGKKHFDVFIWVLKKLGKDLEESIIGEQIIRRLVDLNYDVDKYPKFKFEDMTEEGTQVKSLIIAAGIQSGFINPTEPWIRRYLALPKLEEGVELIDPRMQELIGKISAGGGVGAKQPVNIPDKGQDESTQTETSGKVKEFSDALKHIYGFTSPYKKKTSIIKPEVEKFAEDTNLPQSKFEKKFKYAKIKKELGEYEAETVNSLESIVQKQKDALINDVVRKRILEDSKTGEVNKIQLKYVGEFKKEIEKRLVKLYLDSKITAVNEMIEGGSPIEMRVLFQGQAVQDWVPVPPREAIEFFNRKVLAKVVKEDGTKKVIELATGRELPYYSAKAFAIAGVERDSILTKAKETLLEGIRTGNTQEAIFNLESLFDSYLRRGELRDGSLVKPHRLENIVRTNMTEALNAGRKEMFQHADVVDFVPYWQYSAIMDDRVRSAHAAMHGRIYKSNDPIWSRILPPNGFNCRCTVVPITTIEVESAGVEVGSRRLPVNFPDQGFIKFVENEKTYAKKTPKAIPVVSEEEMQIWDTVLGVGGDREKVKYVFVGPQAPEEAVVAKEYEWVTKCPYTRCGSSTVKMIRRMDGAMVFKCDSCNHLFKVLQEGDVYLYDVGSEKWLSADMKNKPSYFVAELGSKKYYFDSEESREEKLRLAEDRGLNMEAVKTYTEDSK